MATKIETLQASLTGESLYAIVFRSGDPWHVPSNSFWPGLPVPRDEFAIALIETPSGSGFFTADFPSAIPAGNYPTVVYQQNGESPSSDDPEVASGTIEHDMAPTGGTGGISYRLGKSSILIRETVPPQTEPVTVEEFKHHSRIDIDDDDAYIESTLKAARKAIERRLGIAGIHRTLSITIDQFPRDGGPLYLPISPLAAITAITYRDANGETKTWGASNYIVAKGEGGSVFPVTGIGYPGTDGSPNAVTISGVFGEGDEASSVSEDVKHAIKVLSSTWYEYRESVGVGSVPTIPHGLEWLISGLKWSWGGVG